LDCVDDPEHPTQQVEDFLLFHWPVEGRTDIDMSLNSLSHAHPLGNGQIEFQQIGQAPFVLVIQLNRLMSELTADGLRIRKLRSDFQDDERINLKKLLAAEEDIIDELQGVVYRRSTDKQGHSVSAVRSVDSRDVCGAH
jgi:hypothetical protein